MSQVVDDRTAAAGDRLPPPSVARGILRLLRPKQWAKNVLVFAAPGAAGVLTVAGDLAATVVAFVAFCLAASGTYALNDAADAEADRRHPRKRHRPVAAGVISPGAARLLGIALIAGGIAIGGVTGWQLPATTAGYVVLTTSYTLWLKHIAVVDLAAVAAGFVVRALAGAAATEVEVSDFFLIVASFGSLFMVAGKRAAELADGGPESAGQRAVLAEYSREFLTYVRAVASGVTLLAYTLFAFEKAAGGGGLPWFELSIVPFVLAIFRYALRLDRGEGGAPEDVVLGDRTLLVLGAAWAALFAAGVHSA